jgi:hypothetical protein
MLTRFRGITRNEETYPDAETFNPARWLEPKYPTYKEPLTQHPNLHGFSQFGFGRRTCQGVPIVEQDLFLAMGGLAWALDIHKKRRADGTEVPVHWNEYSPLLIAKPAPFEFDATPRSEAITQQLKAMWESGKDEDDIEEERRRMVEELMRSESAREKDGHDDTTKDDDAASINGSDTSGPSDGGSDGSDSTSSDKESWA